MKRFFSGLVIITAVVCLIFASTVVVPSEAVEVDIVIVGAGGSGLSAAVSAASEGASVAVLEKMPVSGGTANFAEGLFAAESALQREKNMLITKDFMFKIIMEYSHWRANARLVRAIVDKSPETIEWLIKQGVEFIEPTAIYPGGLPTWHIIKGRGKAMCKTLEAKAKELGVTFYFNTPGKELMVDEKNTVRGVVAESKSEGRVELRSKAVIIATGGFANNPEMIKQYTDFGGDLIVVGNVNKMGDGIQMAWKAGAAPLGTSVLQLYRPGIPKEGPTSQLNAAGRQPYLWVNRNGERFCDETVIFQWPWAGNALANQQDSIMYTVFDENTKKYMMEKGIDVGVGVLVPVTTKLTQLDEDIQRGIEKGFAFSAATVEELAAQIKVPAGTLEETIETYNAMCSKYRDTLFAKDSKYLQPVATAPFYAIKLFPAILGTLGGIAINEKTEVINQNHEVIPGLYAVGNCAGGMYGDSYDLTVPGGTLGFAVNSGRIAAENAVKYLRK